MSSVNNFTASDFNLEEVRNLKGDSKLIVVFSTFGEREADLIFEKISLLQDEIGSVIDKIYLSHRRAGADSELTETRAKEAYEGTEVIICNDFSVPDMEKEKGKGADMRRLLYHINTGFARGDDPAKYTVVFLDADVVKEYFGIHFVLGLAGAVLKGYDFAKASFWREMGRVKKYVAQPLFSIIEHEDLENLRKLAYPLSGEVAGTLDFFNGVHFWQMYGVETGINIDSSIGDYKIADVNLGRYDHEHHGDVGIQKMSFGIIRTYFKQMVDYGYIELKKGAKLSDNFSAQFIDEDKSRQKMDFDLTERKYAPLWEIV